MKIIFDKIYRDIEESEIIQDIEREKHMNPKFDINLGYKDNWSLLMNAVYHCREDLIRYLLSDPNINVNHRSKYGNYTVLYICDQVSILKLLLSCKDLLDVNIQNEWGRTGLYQVCYWRRKACVKEYLLDARINVLIRDNNGKTARDIALEQGQPDIAKIIRISEYTTLLRIPNRALLYDIVRMIIEEYA